MTAVLSLSRALAERPDVPERTKQGLHHIHGAAARMEQLIEVLQGRFAGAQATPSADESRFNETWSKDGVWKGVW